MSSQTGVSSLMVASFNGHIVVVDKLLQHGATVDLQHNVMAHKYSHEIQATTICKLHCEIHIPLPHTVHACTETESIMLNLGKVCPA